MTTVFHARPYGRFIKTQSNFRRKKDHRTNQSSNFLRGSIGIRDNVRAQESNLEEKHNSSILKIDFSSRTDPSILTSIAPLLLHHLNKTGWVFPGLKSTNHFLPQSTVSCRSDSSSEPNSSCCYRPDAWSHLVESSIISKDSTITDNIIRKVINV